MSQFAGATVLITGGASGIGKIMTRLALERRARVVVWDINPQALAALAEGFSRKGQLHTYVVDVAKATEIERTAAQMIAEGLEVDIVVNNAGIIVGKHFEHHSPADIQRTIDINTTAPMLIAAHFLPGMLARDRGHVCNIASSAGLIANPKMTVYAGSKWGLVGWSDSLRLELEQLGKGVRVTSILPYYINTGMFDGVESRIPILDPESASLTIIRAIEQDKRLVTLPGYIYRLTRIAQGLLPIGAFDWVAGKVLGIYRTMDGFRGRVS